MKNKNLISIVTLISLILWSQNSFLQTKESDFKKTIAAKKDSEPQPEKNTDAINYLCTNLTPMVCTNCLTDTQAETIMAKTSHFLSPQSQVSMNIVSSSDNTKIMNMKGLIKENECLSFLGQIVVPAPALGSKPEDNQSLCSWKKPVCQSSQPGIINTVAVGSGTIDKQLGTSITTDKTGIVTSVTPEGTGGNNPVTAKIISLEGTGGVGGSGITEPETSTAAATTTVGAVTPSATGTGGSNSLAATTTGTEIPSTTGTGGNSPVTTITTGAGGSSISPLMDPSLPIHQSENQPVLVIYCEEGSSLGWYIDDHKEIRSVDLSKACPEVLKENSPEVVDQSEIIRKVLENPKGHPEAVNTLKKKVSTKLSNILAGNANDNLLILHLTSNQEANNTQAGLQVVGDAIHEIDGPTFRSIYSKLLIISPEGNVSYQPVSTNTSLNTFLKAAQVGLNLASPSSSDNGVNTIAVPYLLANITGGGGCSLIRE